VALLVRRHHLRATPYSDHRPPKVASEYALGELLSCYCSGHPVVDDCLGPRVDSPLGMYDRGSDIHGRISGGRMAVTVVSGRTEAWARIPQGDPSHSLEFSAAAHRAGFCDRPFVAKAEAAFLDQGCLDRSSFCAQLPRSSVAFC